jgi:hypothetical protein
MKKRGETIEVLFFEGAEFQLTPLARALENDDCPEPND